MRSARVWGLAGLLVFEASVLSFTLAAGASQFTLTALAALALLGFAAWKVSRASPVPRWVFAALAAVALWRALAQTSGNPAPLALLPSYLVPLGFALLAWRGVGWQGPAAIALARTWFIAWYAVVGATPLVLGNLAGAAGAWVWAWGERAPAGAAHVPTDDPSVSPR